MEGYFFHKNFCAKAAKAFDAVSITWKAIVFVFFLIFFGAFVSSRWIDSPYIQNNHSSKNITLPKWNSTQKPQTISSPSPKPIPILACQAHLNSSNMTCPSNPSFPPFPSRPTSSSSPACPNYFRWIHEDLRPWAATGISRETLESSKIHAAFRLIIVDGRAYVHQYHRVFQTRDTFTLWGIVQLLRRYPGRVPDLDLMFNCDDMPVVPAAAASSPPPSPLFRYCKDDSTVDIVFPDWSFWGWPEVNLRCWAVLMEELREASEGRQWVQREPYAYWKGNPYVSETRMDLMKCNVNRENDWKARLFTVNWDEEERLGFPSSNLASQCNYRYKVYIEGRSWSVSEKYILGCGSPTLYVDSKYKNIVSRGLRPGRHYWPILQEDKCRAIKQAVDWGNKHTEEVQAIGKAASKFINEELKMDYIYDYMLHLLTEYSKLLTYKPTKPVEAVELCSELVACPFEGKVKSYLLESMEMGPTYSEPCSLSPPFRGQELGELLAEKAGGTKNVVKSLMERNAGKRVVDVGQLWCFFLLMIVAIVFA